jgi:hypothetical protein
MKFACILTFIIIKTNVDRKKYYSNKHGRKKRARKNYILECKECYIIATPHGILGGPIKH